jgi:putative DNA methylase
LILPTLRTTNGVDIARFCVESRGQDQAKLGTLEKLLDPFAGGGSIPLEAQRLGLEAHASDLNPVAVLINKALIEIPPKFAGHSPVNPESCKKYLQREWKNAEGLAEDVRYYGKWMRDEAEKRIGHLYPKVQLPKEYGGGETTVIAWIWARTVICPNPACNTQMPLAHSFELSTKKDKMSWVEPVVDRASIPPRIGFMVKNGASGPLVASKVGRGAKFRCLACGAIAPEQHIKNEGFAGRIGAQLMAIVAEGKHGRLYLSPNNEQVTAVEQACPEWSPEQEMPKNPRWFSPPLYGMTTYADIFTSRQLTALNTFSDLVLEAREKVRTDASITGLFEDEVALNNDDVGADAYANAVATYLGLGVSRLSDICNALCPWEPSKTQVRHLYGRQAIPMLWDFAEPNVFAEAAGDFIVSLGNLVKALEALPSRGRGWTRQLDATAAVNGSTNVVISTDPPYYDNISYAELSDFFYVWLRRSLGRIYPELFSTVLTPKTNELIVTSHRFSGGKEAAKSFFELGLGTAFVRFREYESPSYPITVYYGFKQSENDTDGEEEENGKFAVASTGWETMLEGLLRAGFTITGTWPMRTELISSLKKDIGALASSIILVCQPRPIDAPTTTRRDFLNALKRELPRALRDLQRGNIAPVDLAQAAIGPGMAVFSRYNKVLESDGTPMRVRTALQLINQALDEVLAEQEGEYDADTRWAIAWFEQYSMGEGPYGVAETLSKAKNTAVSALVDAGILRALGGKVRLLPRYELSSDWNPATARRLTVWEVTQRLIRALQEHGDTGVAAILNHVGTYSEAARDLAYRLYTVCERKKWADEALAYNSLVVEWSDISGAVEQLRRTTAEQAPLFS